MAAWELDVRSVLEALRRVAAGQARVPAGAASRPLQQCRQRGGTSGFALPACWMLPRFIVTIPRSLHAASPALCAGDVCAVLPGGGVCVRGVRVHPLPPRLPTQLPLLQAAGAVSGSGCCRRLAAVGQRWLPRRAALPRSRAALHGGQCLDGAASVAHVHTRRLCHVTLCVVHIINGFIHCSQTRFVQPEDDLRVLHGALQEQQGGPRQPGRGVAVAGEACQGAGGEAAWQGLPCEGIKQGQGSVAVLATPQLGSALPRPPPPPPAPPPRPSPPRASSFRQRSWPGPGWARRRTCQSVSAAAAVVLVQVGRQSVRGGCPAGRGPAMRPPAASGCGCCTSPGRLPAHTAAPTPDGWRLLAQYPHGECRLPCHLLSCCSHHGPPPQHQHGHGARGGKDGAVWQRRGGAEGHRHQAAGAGLGWAMVEAEGVEGRQGWLHGCMAAWLHFPLPCCCRQLPCPAGCPPLLLRTNSPHLLVLTPGAKAPPLTRCLACPPCSCTLRRLSTS